MAYKWFSRAMTYQLMQIYLLPALDGAPITATH